MFDEFENKFKEERDKKQNDFYIEIGKMSASRATASKYNKERIAKLEAQKKEIEADIHRIKYEENFYQSEYLKEFEKMTLRYGILK